MAIEQTKDLSPENKTVWGNVKDFITPYRLAGSVLFVLFVGADVSLYYFGQEATGNSFLALTVTLLSGVGTLLWKYQRDNDQSNEFQRSAALAMIVMHAAAAVIFLVGNFARGGWDALADKVKLDGVLAAELINYQMVSEKVFIWTIAIMAIANIVALFLIQENDTEKINNRLLAEIRRKTRKAELDAQSEVARVASQEYESYSKNFGKLQGLREAREKIVMENKGRLPDDVVANMLAPIDQKIIEVSGMIPVGPASANTSESATAPFQPAPSRTK
jgi:hypothetical protein